MCNAHRYRIIVTDTYIYVHTASPHRVSCTRHAKYALMYVTGHLTISSLTPRLMYSSLGPSEAPPTLSVGRMGCRSRPSRDASTGNCKLCTSANTHTTEAETGTHQVTLHGPSKLQQRALHSLRHYHRPLFCDHAHCLLSSLCAEGGSLHTLEGVGSGRDDVT